MISCYSSWHLGRPGIMLNCMDRSFCRHLAADDLRFSTAACLQSDSTIVCLLCCCFQRASLSHHHERQNWNVNCCTVLHHQPIAHSRPHTDPGCYMGLISAVLLCCLMSMYISLYRVTTAWSGKLHTSVVKAKVIMPVVFTFNCRHIQLTACKVINYGAFLSCASNFHLRISGVN
jgi:hypothetical protein